MATWLVLKPLPSNTPDVWAVNMWDIAATYRESEYDLAVKAMHRLDATFIHLWDGCKVMPGDTFHAKLSLSPG